jgi:hypothetical protein
MPELPEVEITRRGLLPLISQTVDNVVIRNFSIGKNPKFLYLTILNYILPSELGRLLVVYGELERLELNENISKGMCF